MSEETIEERYERVSRILKRMERRDYHVSFAMEIRDVLSPFFKDLMAERELVKELVCKIDGYGFECEGGPLENCLEWIELRGIANVSNK